MKTRFERTLFALCASLDEGWNEARDVEPARRNNTVDFVLDQVQALPDILIGPVKLMTVMFDITAVFKFRKAFHRLSGIDRLRHIEYWRRSRLGFCRDLIRFYESLVAMIVCSTWGER